MTEINKTLDLKELEQKEFITIIKGIESLIADLKTKGLKFTTYQAEFDDDWGKDDIWFKRKLWEICAVITYSDLSQRCRILDCGGASTIFSFYLASLGHDVDTVDIDWRRKGIIDNANAVAGAMGWKMNNIRAGIADLPYDDETFDRVFSICVLEHLPFNEQTKAIKEMSRVLRPDGIMALTFDYGPNAYGEKYSDIHEINRRIIEPSGLTVMGNTDYAERGWFRELPGKTWGSLFLRKPENPAQSSSPVFLTCVRPQWNVKSRIEYKLWLLKKKAKDMLWTCGIRRSVFRRKF